MNINGTTNPTPEQITAHYASEVVFNLLTDAQKRAIGLAIESIEDDGGWEVRGDDGLNLNHMEAEKADELEEMPRNPWLMAYPKADDTDRALVIEVHPNGAAQIYEYTGYAAGRPYVQLEDAINAVCDAWRREFAEAAPR